MRLIIKEHEVSANITYKINDTNKFFLLVYYYSSVPIFDILIIITLLDEINLTVRLAALYALNVGFLIMLNVNYFVASVPTIAHKPYNRLNINTIIVTKNLYQRFKGKVLGLIEKLSGPVIGYYCYDLFISIH